MSNMPNIVREGFWLPFNGPANPPPVRRDDMADAARYFRSSYVSELISNYNRADTRFGSKGLEEDVFLHNDEAPKLWAKPSSDIDRLCFSVTEDALYPFKSYSCMKLDDVSRAYPHGVARASSAGYYYLISKNFAEAVEVESGRA
eukprot:1930150-Amphidinium_carterae.1